MKLAFIIIPLDGPNKSLTYLINRTVNDFTEEFGGSTFYEVYGQWKGDGKQIKATKIEVAVPSDEHDVFIMMAKDVAVEAGVEEIMVQAPDGEILFIPGVK